METAETGSGDAPRLAASRVFVLAKGGEPLMSCHPARARELLDSGRAVVARRAPFAIRLKHRTRAGSAVGGVQLRLDPGSKATGVAITDEHLRVGSKGRTTVARRGLITIELRHRGQQIRGGMMRRAAYRRRRRSANLRYRAPRHDNRPRPDGWLPPSVRHRVDSTMSVVMRLRRYAPVREIHVEQVAFDTAAFAGAIPSGALESTTSTHGGSEIREFLLAKWKGSCTYCDATGVPLNIEHVRPRSRGGSDRVSNLVLACVPCNQAKGTAPIEEFLSDQPARLERVIIQLRRPLQDVAAMNATRLQLVKELAGQGVPVHAWSGGRTRWNGDLVAAVVPQGKWAGSWVGRIAVRTSGQHRITTLTSRFDVSHRNLRLLQRADGYAYGFAAEIRLSERHGPA
ncbi:RNA-guided endonuclease IscB [Streptomyces sp. 147326]|uniref:RNA-guided endonuclease IscB n=1 Tax=Streptomyces sp. 147326 TaxID=3074379 RepID=UPI003857B12A